LSFDSIRSVQAGLKVGAKVHNPITGKRQLMLRLARRGHRKRSRFRLPARACLLSRRTTRIRTNTITTATAVTDHNHRQSFLSLSRPSQQIPASTNTRDTRHRGRTDQSHRQYYLSPSRPLQQPTDTTNPCDTSHRCRTDHFHSQELLHLVRTAQPISASTNPIQPILGGSSRGATAPIKPELA
jgi:hypothetical protein